MFPKTFYLRKKTFSSLKGLLPNYKTDSSEIKVLLIKEYRQTSCYLSKNTDLQKKHLSIMNERDLLHMVLRSYF